MRNFIEGPGTFKVIEWNEAEKYHVCKDECGDVWRLDLNVSGEIDMTESLVGKTVQVESVHAYIGIASYVSLVEGGA